MDEPHARRLRNLRGVSYTSYWYEDWETAYRTNLGLEKPQEDIRVTELGLKRFKQFVVNDSTHILVYATNSLAPHDLSLLLRLTHSRTRTHSQLVFERLERLKICVHTPYLFNIIICYEPPQLCRTYIAHHSPVHHHPPYDRVRVERRNR